MSMTLFNARPRYRRASQITADLYAQIPDPLASWRRGAIRATGGAFDARLPGECAGAPIGAFTAPR